MLTVKETLMFASEFRLARSLPKSKKMERVQALIDQLGLRNAADTVIGDEGHRGVSGGERRRVSIGIDIIHNPIVLFLDEPTSGLDSTNAFMISENRSVWVNKYEGRAFLSIGKKNTTHEIDRPFIGMHFSTYQWSSIKNNFNAIDEAINHFQSKPTQNGDSTSKPMDNNNKNTHGFSRIETSRFDGKSYLHWSSQMELFLKQLKLTYVPSEPCPRAVPEFSS